MMSTYAPWWKRKILFRTPLYRRQACGNFHWFLDRLCHCEIGCNGQEGPKVLR